MGANDYEHNVDLVCEGGGVKGIGLAGAYSVLDERGYKPQNVAGTSAGAITAALIAAGYSSAELKEVVFGLDFRRFEDKSWEDHIPVIGTPLSILIEEGIFKGDEFLTWMRGLLAAKNVHTFADLKTEFTDPKYTSRLQVIASHVTARQLLGLPRAPAALRSGMVPTMMEAHDRLYLEKAKYARTISIPTLGVHTTEFDITPERTQALYESGRSAAEKFLETWNFEAYVQEFRTGKTHSRRAEIAAELQRVPVG